MKHRVVIIASVVLLLGILSIGLGLWQLTVRNKPLPAAETLGINSASSKSVDGLSLSLSLDSTTYQPGQYVSIVIDEKNTLSKTNKVPVADKELSHQLRLGPCNPLMSAFGIAVFKGDCTPSDFSTATPLVIFNPNAIYHCQGISIPFPTYNFEPSSDVVNDPNLNSTFEMNTKIIINGSWVGDRPAAILTYFEPGVYTVFGGDEWGTLVIVHFTVTS